MVTTYNSTRTLTDDASLTDALEFFKLKNFQQINTIILGTVLDVDSINKRLVVKSLINGVNSQKAPINPPTIYDVPYGAVRGGNAGIITHFVEGDNVVIGFCQKQIDSTKATGGASTPTLYRFFSLQDAVVLSHWSNNDPTIYLKITNEEVTIQATTKPVTITTTGDVVVNSTNATINATTLAKIEATNIELDGIVTINGQPYLSHVHTGVTTGGGNSGPVL